MKVTFTLIVLAFSSIVFGQQDPPVIESREVFQEDLPSDPEYPGGPTAMMKFIANNVQYPQSAIQNMEQGKVYVQLVIEKDGSVTNVEVMRGVSEAIDREALRVVNKMPNWKPGEVNGKKVRVRQIIPISFRLD